MRLKNESKWEKYKKLNEGCDYGMACINAAQRTMELIDDGREFDDAMSEGFAGKGLSGFQASAAATMVVDCHEQGEEFKVYWNTRAGAPELKGVADLATGGVM